MSAPYLSAKNSLDVVCKEVLKNDANDVFTSMLGMTNEEVPCKLDTKHIHQLLRTTFTIQVICIQDSPVRNMYIAIFVDKEYPLTYIIDGSNLQLAMFGSTI